MGFLIYIYETAAKVPDNGGVCCGKKMVEKTENFELVCQSCGRLEELDTTTHNPRKEEKGWLPVVISHIHIRQILEKHGIFDAVNTSVLTGREVCDISRWLFLGNVIHNLGNFPLPNRHSVNYVCFFTITLKRFQKKLGRAKKKILEKLSTVFEKIRPKTRRRAKERFDRWWNSYFERGFSIL